jgi:hypothetical protein
MTGEYVLKVSLLKKIFSKQESQRLDGVMSTICHIVACASQRELGFRFQIVIIVPAICLMQPRLPNKGVARYLEIAETDVLERFRASARANPHLPRRAPHGAGREAEAVGSGRGRDKGEDARRLRGAEEEAARSLDIRIAWPRNGRGAPAARVVVGRLARHLGRNGLSARELADEQGRCAAIGPAGLARGQADLSSNLRGA